MLPALQSLVTLILISLYTTFVESHLITHLFPEMLHVGCARLLFNP